MYRELSGQGLEVITVAEDAKGPEGVMPFIEPAQPSHPSLLDPGYVVAGLYNTKNVPAAFWIDEDGRIVRANDPIYVLRRNRETGESTVHQAYLDGIRDWVRNGSLSIYLHNEETVRERIGEYDWGNVQAMTHFRLGIHLPQRGESEAAIVQFKQAHALKPTNWNYRRQAFNLGDPQGDYGTTMQELRNDPSSGPFYLPLELPSPPV